jgi:ATP-dependent Clp protease ATP-binding subunit ClpC
LNHPFAAALIAELDTMQLGSVDREFLATFGRLWSGDDTEILLEPSGWEPPLAAARASLERAVPRSLLVSGDHMVGKSSLLRILACRLRPQGWTVFEASGADLMAGQIWFGQLEGRLRRATEEITVAKKLIWYIPDLLQLARSGTHQGQSASILDQILPAMASGRLVVWTDAEPSAAGRLLQAKPVLRGVLETVRLEPESEENARALARSLVARLAAERALELDGACADTAVSCARQYLGSAGLPGSALHLLKLSTARAEGKPRLVADDVLATLSQLTGLPTSILNSKERIDLASVREFFASRVMGQDEAVTCLIDRIAMLKAGLNDPNRPLGVFLFAGPTGTGKTELAKTTAQYLFGSVDRLIRLDMSELQTGDVSLLLGGGIHGETDSLIQRVRKQPFSVVLLDEFEKAHPRVWDLFLQVFDDGRLTDTLGQVADFRHCIIILTSNLGAGAHQSSSFGFASTPALFAADQVTRAISQTYRPEFQNRLDRVIVFRPLTRDLMRIILQKELKQVLERRGLRDRAWAVEWEASALEFLLEKGFSPEMGARPLKRAIEQFVIAPLAATIVEQRFPEGEQFVFFRSNGRAIQAEFVDPDSDMSSATPASDIDSGDAAGLSAIILAPSGNVTEFDLLLGECARVKQSLAAPEWDELKRQLAEKMSNEAFWKSPGRYEALARLALMDRVATAIGTSEALRTRLERGSRLGRYSRELLSRLALQLWLIRQGVQDVLEGAAVEVAVLVEPALEAASADCKDFRAWTRQLWGMYRAWCDRRHMQVEEIAGRDVELPILLVTGFGAHRVLLRECGLHILELAESGNAVTRATARMRLVATPLQELPPAKMHEAISHAFEQAPRLSAIVRRYRAEPSPLVRNADGSRRSGRLQAVLRGDFDLLMQADGG